MLSLRTCAVALRSGVFALRSSVLARPDAVSTAGIVTSSSSSSCSQIRSFSSALTNYGNGRVASGSLSSTLPALAFRSNGATVIDGYNGLLVNPCRSIMKNFWPRPRETKRIKNHGWKKRMSTPAGRKIIMMRILRGRHVLSH